MSSSARTRASFRAPSGGVIASVVKTTRATRRSVAVSPRARASLASSCANEAASRENAGVLAFPQTSRSAHAWLSRASAARGFLPGNAKTSASAFPARNAHSCASDSSPAYPASSIASTQRFATSSRARCSRCFGTRSSGRGARSDSRNASKASSRADAGGTRAADFASAETSIARDAARSVAGDETRTTSRRRRWLVTGFRGRQEASGFACFSTTQKRRRTVDDARSAISRQPTRDATVASRLHMHVPGMACAASTGLVASPTPLITAPEASKATTANA